MSPKPHQISEWQTFDGLRGQHSVTDPDYLWSSQIYVSIDGKWIWKRNAGGNTSEKADWVPNPFGFPRPKQENQNQERTVASMIHTIVVTTRAVVNTSTNQIVQPERIVAGPDNDILAPDQNVALLMFGVKHKAELEKVDPGLIVVQIRQGI